MSLDNLTWWTLNVDEASWKTGAGIGFQLKSPTGETFKQAICLGFGASNNESEYEAILAGIELAASVSAVRILIRSDSQLVLGQVNKEYESRDPRMEKYASLVKQHLGNFLVWKLEHIPRDCNEKVDALAAVAASLMMKETVFLFIYYRLDSSIITTRVSQVDEVSRSPHPGWTS